MQATFIKMIFLFLALPLLPLGCGFHMQGEKHLSPQLQRLYVQAQDPYGYLVRNLQQYLRLSHVQLVTSPAEALTTLAITQDSTSQHLLSVSGTQQTRQYLLQVTVTFEINNAKGQMIVQPQTLTESRAITVQSNQILGSSNEATLYYQQMRRALAYAIINRLASKEVTHLIDEAFHPTPKKHTL